MCCPLLHHRSTYINGHQDGPRTAKAKSHSYLDKLSVVQMTTPDTHHCVYGCCYQPTRCVANSHVNASTYHVIHVRIKRLVFTYMYIKNVDVMHILGILAGCSSAVCPWSTVLESWRDTIGECDMSAICDVDSAATTSTAAAGLVIMTAIILGTSSMTL